MSPYAGEYRHERDPLVREFAALRVLKARTERMKAWAMRIKDAEHECVHGNIRGHPTQPDPCGCWPDEVLFARWCEVQDSSDAQDAA